MRAGGPPREAPAGVRIEGGASCLFPRNEVRQERRKVGPRFSWVVRLLPLSVLCLVIASCENFPEEDRGLLKEVPEILRGTWLGDGSIRIFSSDTSSLSLAETGFIITARVIEVEPVDGKAVSGFPLGYKITSIWNVISSIPQLAGQKAVDFCFVSADGKKMWIDNGFPPPRNEYLKQ